jgi:hypothetical protein
MRYLYFIDASLPYVAILELVADNLRVWGGRYNPIVPVSGGFIDADYRDMIQYYDPDVIFHSGTIDPEVIKELRFFNPSAFVNMDAPILEFRAEGLSALHLLSAVDRRHPVILPHGLFQVESPLRDYFRINFGIESTSYVGDDRLAADREQISVGPKEFDRLNEILYTKKPILQTELTARLPHTPILRSLRQAPQDAFELVIARDTADTADLLYFWNRHLYQCHHLLYVTLEQLSLLRKDPYFGALLYDMTPAQVITVVSLSIPQPEIEEIIRTHLRFGPAQRHFHYKKVERFPFPVDDGLGSSYLPFGKPAIQTLSGRETLLFIPPLPYTSVIMQPQQWAVDLAILELGDQSGKVVRFPYTTDTRPMLRDVDSRIDRNRQISYYFGGSRSNSQAMDLRLSSFDWLLHQLIPSPVIDGIPIKTRYLEIGPHDPSSRLSAFISLFNGNFHQINEYFSDKFWKDLFDDLCQSEAAAGDAISLKDLTRRCRKLMEGEGMEFGSWPATRYNDENLTLGLKEMLRELTALSVLIQGHTLKCPRCATTAWYPLEQISTLVRCTGCLRDFPLPIEPAFTFRLNGLVQKNIFQSRTQRDGNLTVIQTLARLSERSHGAFQYSPQLNLYSDPRQRKVDADIDIVALPDGELVIGEAKYSSAEFSADKYKCLKSLIAIAEAIRPDRVILSCSVDQYDKLHRAEQFLRHHCDKTPYAPEIEAFKIPEPTYFNFRTPLYFYY